MKGYLDIDIGDISKYNEDLVSYNKTIQFYTDIYQNYGWEKHDSIENCTEEEKEIIEGEYCSRKLSGNLNFSKPLELRVGRIVIEFFDDCPKTVANFKVGVSYFIPVCIILFFVGSVHGRKRKIKI